MNLLIIKAAGQDWDVQFTFDENSAQIAIAHVSQHGYECTRPLPSLHQVLSEPFMQFLAQAVFDRFVSEFTTFGLQDADARPLAH
jgi:hypothetical protein